jgi:hypothetical protein
VDFLDLAGEAAVAPFRWRVHDAPPETTVMVLINDEFFEEFPIHVADGAPADGLSRAETLPPGRYAAVLQLIDSQSGAWLGIESPRRTLLVDGDSRSSGSVGRERKPRTLTLPSIF